MWRKPDIAAATALVAMAATGAQDVRAAPAAITPATDAGDDTAATAAMAARAVKDAMAARDALARTAIRLSRQHPRLCPMEVLVLPNPINRRAAVLRFAGRPFAVERRVARMGSLERLLKWPHPPSVPWKIIFTNCGND